MAIENPPLGAPGIHGELFKFGFDVAKRTVQRFMPKRPARPGSLESWKAFLRTRQGGQALRWPLSKRHRQVPGRRRGIVFDEGMSMDGRRGLRCQRSRHGPIPRYQPVPFSQRGPRVVSLAVGIAHQAAVRRRPRAVACAPAERGIDSLQPVETRS
jgi:hypothetical protein